MARKNRKAKALLCHPWEMQMTVTPPPTEMVVYFRKTGDTNPWFIGYADYENNVMVQARFGPFRLLDAVRLSPRCPKQFNHLRGLVIGVEDNKEVSVLWNVSMCKLGD